MDTSLLQLVGKIKSELSSLEGDEMTQISGLFNREDGAQPLQPKNFPTCVSASFLKCYLCVFARGVAVLIPYYEDPDPICSGAEIYPTRNSDHQLNSKKEHIR
jgi:hypothetical protein